MKALRQRTVNRTSNHYEGQSSISSKQSASFMQKVRSWLLERVEEGTPVVLSIQRYRNPLLDFYFKLATFCGDKIFYITLVPCFFWLGDPHLGRLFTLLLTTNVFVGNFIKDALSLPRPPSPPVWRSKKENDSGLPSTHSMVAVSLSTFLIFYLEKQGLLIVDTRHYIMLALWIVSICLSRMYLGVHSPADVTAGLFIGSATSWIWLHYATQIDNFLLRHQFVPISVLAFVIFSTITHPRCIHTPSYSRSISVVGLSVGVVLGSWYSQIVPISSIATIASPSLRILIFKLRQSSLWNQLSLDLWKIVLRLVIGFFLLNVCFIIMVNFFNLVFYLAFRIPLIRRTLLAIDKFCSRFNIPTFEETPKEKDVKSSKKFVKREDDLDPSTWSKFVTLSLLACGLVDTIPALFIAMDKYLIEQISI